jgi:hypothetical protein
VAFSIDQPRSQVVCDLVLCAWMDEGRATTVMLYGCSRLALWYLL